MAKTHAQIISYLLTDGSGDLIHPALHDSSSTSVRLALEGWQDYLGPRQQCLPVGLIKGQRKYRFESLLVGNRSGTKGRECSNQPIPADC